MERKNERETYSCEIHGGINCISLAFPFSLGQIPFCSYVENKYNIKIKPEIKKSNLHWNLIQSDFSRLRGYLRDI